MTKPQEAMTVRIGQAVMLHRGGDREEARNRFAQMWYETDPERDLFHRCTIAHYMADTQDDPQEELEWDRRALAAAEALTEDHVEWGEHSLAVRSLYPSLHLNLAGDHAALGEHAAARHALEKARSASRFLADDEYGRGIREAIDRLRAGLEHAGPGPA